MSGEAHLGADGAGIDSFKHSSSSFSISRAAAQDPWAKFPAFPTFAHECYSKDDGFEQALSYVRHELVTALDREMEINSSHQRQGHQPSDGQSQSAKMIAFMPMDHAMPGGPESVMVATSRFANRLSTPTHV